MKKRYIIGLVICCLMIIPLVGCTTKKATTTGTTKTPLALLTDRVNASDAVNTRQDQNITDRVNASDAVNTRQDQNITDLSNRITNEVGAITPQDLGPLTARIGILEALGFSDVVGNLSFLTIRVASLESYFSGYNSSQISLIFRNLLNMSVNGTIVMPTPTPITPTPTPTVNCTLVTKPVALYPELGNMSMVNGSILFRWADSNASGYEFWFGTNPASLLKVDTLSKDALFYPFPATGSNTYYFWRVVALSPCGNQSTMWWFKTQ